MNRLRRSVATAAGLAVLAEAVALGALHWILGLVVRAQEMSLAGVSASTITYATWSGGALLGGFLLLCAGVLARSAVRDRLTARPARMALVGCLVLHAVLAVLAVVVAGWWAFAAAMAVFGLVLLVLNSYEPDRRDGPAADDAADGTEPALGGPPFASGPTGTALA